MLPSQCSKEKKYFSCVVIILLNQWETLCLICLKFGGWPLPKIVCCVKIRQDFSPCRFFMHVIKNKNGVSVTSVVGAICVFFHSAILCV